MIFYHNVTLPKGNKLLNFRDYSILIRTFTAEKPLKILLTYQQQC